MRASVRVPLAVLLLLTSFPEPGWSASPSSALAAVRQLNEVFVDISEKAARSVVVVQVAQKPETDADVEKHPLVEQMPEEWRKRFEEFRDQRKRSREQDGPSFDGEGSGIIYREDGHILTNAHVVENAERIRVKLRDGREFEADVRGLDTDSDIAVLRIRGEVKGLVPARFGNSDQVRVGEFAVAIGAPYELEYSVTFGHISAKGRAGLTRGMMDEDFLQTDANINPGNSGGPLLNLDGEVVGVNSMIRGVGTGICFAIPSNLAREVADQLVQHGRFRRSWLGVQIEGLRENERLRREFPGIADGVFISNVTPDGPAERAELRSRDVILSVGGRPVSTVAQLRREITRKAAGTEVVLDVHRDGKARKMKVRLDAMPDPETRMMAARQRGRKSAAPENGVMTEMGLTVQTSTPALVEKFRLGKQPGVVVTAIDPEGRLAEYGFKEGDLIYEVDQSPVKTASQLSEVLRGAQEKEKFLVRYQRAGEKLSAVVLNGSKHGDTP